MQNARHLARNSETIEGEIVGQEELTRQRHVAGRLVGAAQRGGEHGGIAGVETAMAPALITCYLVPFLVHFIWGFVLTLLSLLGAGLYGLRRLWHWLCGGK